MKKLICKLFGLELPTKPVPGRALVIIKRTDGSLLYIANYDRTMSEENKDELREMLQKICAKYDGNDTYFMVPNMGVVYFGNGSGDDKIATRKMVKAARELIGSIQDQGIYLHNETTNQ